MESAKFFVGQIVETPAGVGRVANVRFSSRKGGRYYVIGERFEAYFLFAELERLNGGSVKTERHGKAVPAKTPCSKVHYHSYKLAQERLIKIMKYSRRAKKPVRAYKCPDCGLWHLTSKNIKNPSGITERAEKRAK